MRTQTVLRARTILLTAPAEGRVELCAPHALCGELEVYESGETIARVDGRPVRAPGDGFVLRALTHTGAFASDGMPLLEFRIT